MELNLSLNNLLSEAATTLQGWAEAFFAMLPNLVMALVVVVIAWLVAMAVQSLVRSATQRATTNQQLVGLAGRTARVATICVGLFIALGILELDKTVMSLVAGLGVAGVALGFAFQDIASNFMSGLMMAFRQPFSIGDYIATSGHEGTVEAIDLRSTTMLRFDGVHVIVPNSDVFGNPIVNYTKEPPRRVEVAVGVGYDSDLEKVESVCYEVARSMEGLLEDKPVQVWFTAFGGSSIDLVVRFWTDSSLPGGWLKARSDAMKKLKRRFDQEGIEIPFPITTLDMPKAHVEDFLDALPAVGARRGRSADAAELPNK